MNALTATEKKVLDNLTKVMNPSVALGDTLQEVIDAVGVDGTPVNAVAASKSLAVTGVVKHGEKVTINNPIVTGTDVYEFTTNPMLLSDENNIPVDISAYVDYSSGYLTMDTRPTAGDTVTIGERTYIFVPVGTANAEGEVSIGADLAGAQANLVAAINGTDGINTPHTLVFALDFVANEMSLQAYVGGTIHNTTPTTETFTAATNVFGAATLSGGTDCTAANAILALVDAITASDTQGVGAADGTGDTIDLTADVAGVVGNDISISETMTNAAFAGGATKLSGGVDGTVSPGTKIMVDDTYLYVSIGANTTADANWRRISLSSAY